MSTLLICSLSSETRIGDSFTYWMSHIALMPRFEIGFSVCGDFFDDLRREARLVGPVLVSGAKLANFGPKNDVLVRLVKDETGALTRFHRCALNLMENYGLSCEDATWIGENYRPHITLRHHLQDLPTGKKAILDGFHVITRSANGRKSVVDFISF